MPKPRLLVLQSHPIQYYAPIFRELQRRGAIDVKVIYLTDAGARAHYDAGFGQSVQWDIPLLEGYEYEILQPGSDIIGRTFWQRADSRLLEVAAASASTHVLLFGYWGRMNWQILQWAHRAGKSVLYMSDSNGRVRRPGWKTAVKTLPLRWFFSRVARFLSPSEANEAYLHGFGVDPDRVRFMPFAIDVEHFGGQRRETREINLLWAGKMTPKKRASDFIAALLRLRTLPRPALRAMIVGSGQEEPTLRRMANVLVADGTLLWEGFVNQARLPTLLGNADIFVFSSEKEAYGLAATEAAAAGAALIMADGIGCIGQRTIAQPGVNALVYPPGDVDALCAAVTALLDDPDRLKTMQAESRRLAASHSIAEAARILEATVLELEA